MGKSATATKLALPGALRRGPRPGFFTEERPFLGVTGQKLKRIERYARYTFRAFPRDALNKVLYGPEAPLYAERIWVNPRDCRACLSGLGDSYSGKVVTAGWPPPRARQKEIMEVKKIRSCIDHWENGISWEETGIFDFLEREIENHPKNIFDDCGNRKELKRRYARLDRLFETVKAEGELRTNREVDRWSFRERDGVYCHVGPEASLFFGGVGCHRFSMALVLGLPLIPAKLGCVHVSAITHLKTLRCRPDGI